MSPYLPLRLPWWGAWLPPFREAGRVKSLWWFCRGCSPLPIPNREVKPLMANGTAQPCGRVGSCHIYLKEPLHLFAKALFVFTNTPTNHRNHSPNPIWFTSIQHYNQHQESCNNHVRVIVEDDCTPNSNNHIGLIFLKWIDSFGIKKCMFSISSDFYLFHLLVSETLYLGVDETFLSVMCIHFYQSSVRKLETGKPSVLYSSPTTKSLNA